MKDEDINKANLSPDKNIWHGTPPDAQNDGAYTPIDPDYFVILKMRQVCDLTGMSPRTIKRLIYADQFPQPIQLSRAREAWRKNQVLQFLAGKRSFPIF